MRLLRTREVTQEELHWVLTRPVVDSVEVTPEARERAQTLFGEPLTPLQVVERIINDVRRDKDQAVIRYAQLLDGVDVSERFFVSDEELARAYEKVSKQFLADLELALQNIFEYHVKQKENSWFTTSTGGTILGQKVTPLRTVGAYVPGGTAPLVSTVLMTVVPAKVAGVKNIILATPESKRNGLDPHIVVAAHKAGASKVLRVGGAQAIAALAYGTESIPRVDKIVGPGNIYVTLAKKLVFGAVGIDSLAGPSEILVIADAKARPELVAADLLSQAEHDPEAAAFLLTDSETLASAVQEELQRQMKTLPRREIAATSLAKNGAIVVCDNLAEAVDLANICAPEHLELAVSDPFPLLEKIENAGAIFLGYYASEPVGDYVAGPNHVLPTNGTASFSSPLGVYDFVKRSSIISYTEESLRKVGPAGIRLAEIEGLDAHARAMKLRMQ